VGGVWGGGGVGKGSEGETPMQGRNQGREKRGRRLKTRKVTSGAGEEMQKGSQIQVHAVRESASSSIGQTGVEG